MTTMKFRQLIDMSIGTPEPGHVNFYALHCLLSCIAEKLNIIDETVDFSSYENLIFSMGAKQTNFDYGRLFAGSVRLSGGGGDDEEVADNEQPGTEANVDVDGEVQEQTEKEIQEEEIQKEEEVKNEEIEEIHPEPSAVIKEENGSKKDVVEEVPSLDAIKSEPNQTTDIDVKSVTSSSKSVSSKVSLNNLDYRILQLEDAMKKQLIDKDFLTGVAIMKDQIELSISHLLLLTFLTLSKEPDSKHIQELYAVTKSLKNLHKANVHIQSQKLYDATILPSLSWKDSDLQLDSKVSEDGLFEIHPLDSKHVDTVASKDRSHELKDMDSHLCYSPEKILDQLLELKGEFCLLINKVNEISARVLKQESQQTVSRIQDLQEQMREVKLLNVNLKAQQDRMELRITQNLNTIESLKDSIEELTSDKVDKSELEILLADKVDYNQLQRKVSLDQMLEMQCRMDKRFCEMLRQITENDKKMNMMVDNLKETLGFAAIEGILNTFKDQIEKEIHSLQHLLQDYIDSTNDECAAAGARVKVLQDLACLSCDTTCVMRSMEKAKVAKLPNAHASVMMSPLITYELGSIRKSGIMGYYRKDDFPHAPDAWMNRQGGGLNDKACAPRHAGGPHTTSTARERVEKVMLNKK